MLQTELDIQSSHTWAHNFEFLVKSLGWFIPCLVWCHNILGSQENGHKMYEAELGRWRQHGNKWQDKKHKELRWSTVSSERHLKVEKFGKITAVAVWSCVHSPVDAWRIYHRLEAGVFTRDNCHESGGYHKRMHDNF